MTRICIGLLVGQVLCHARNLGSGLIECMNKVWSFDYFRSI
jgi:hypothetical protein